MARWIRCAGLVAVLAIGESCDLKPPAVPHLDVRAAAAPRPEPPANASRMVVLATLAGEAGTEPDLPSVTLPSR